MRYREEAAELFKREVPRSGQAELIRAYEDPVLDEALYGRLLDHVVEWSRAHPKPIPLEIGY